MLIRLYQINITLIRYYSTGETAIISSSDDERSWYELDVPCIVGLVCLLIPIIIIITYYYRKYKKNNFS